MKNLAPPALRIVAALIDMFIVQAIYLLILLPVFTAGSISQILNAGLFGIVTLIVFVSIIHPVINLYLIASFGGTIGKLLTATEIVDSGGKYLTYKMAFFRNIVGYFVSNVFLWLGFIWILVDRDRRSWHDMIAGSWVVKKSENGLTSGLLVLIILLAANGYLGYNIYKNITRNIPLYRDVIENFTDIFNQKSEIPSGNSNYKSNNKNYYPEDSDFNLDRL